MDDIQSLRKLILNYTNFTHTYIGFVDSYQISIAVVAGLIGLFYLRRRKFIRFLLCCMIIRGRQATEAEKTIAEPAFAISRRIFLPSPLNARFNLHLYCINSKKRLRDKVKERIDGGRSTIKAIRIVTDAATPAEAAYPRVPPIF